MKTSREVSSEKLRGGFYTPVPLVVRCLERVEALSRGQRGITLLEPSAGDGAFIRGLAQSRDFAAAVGKVVAIEPEPHEAGLCAAALADHALDGHVLVDSAVVWSAATDEQFDCAVGNPPYVRFQFVTASDRAGVASLEQRIGLSFSGVSNLWIPVLIGSLTRLRIGGSFAFVIPTECFTGISAGVLRTWLVANTIDLRFDLFPPGSFPGVLQEVTILSGRRSEPSEAAISCEIREYDRAGSSHTATHQIPFDPQPWTRYLLTKTQLGAFEEAQALPSVQRLNKVAKFEVAAVTGANSFFSVDAQTVDRYDLAPWAVPLLPRLRYANGLRYTKADQREVEAAGANAFLLDFAETRPDPLESDMAASYLQTGVASQLPHRYKCRIREPWYRVPFIRSGQLMMSKRSHRFPKVVLNDAAVVTTDTIYRGSMLDSYSGRTADLAAGFHNSLTLLSAEIEGRSFGGGVLELVPSEVGRVVVPMAEDFADELDRLDAVARASSDLLDIDPLVEETDRLLGKADIGLTPNLLAALNDARFALLQRRLDRNTSA